MCYYRDTFPHSPTSSASVTPVTVTALATLFLLLRRPGVMISSGGGTSGRGFCRGGGCSVHVGYCYSMLRSVSQNTKDEDINSIKLHTPPRVHRAGGRAA